MKETSSNNRTEFFKPPVPKGRLPIRNIKKNKEIDYFKNFKNSVVKKNMYEVKYQSPETRISDDQYTDDEDYDESEEEDNINYSLNTSQNSAQLESFSTPHTSSSTLQLHRRSFHNSNTSQDFNTSINFSSYKIKDQRTKGFFSKYLTLCVIIACVLLCSYSLFSTNFLYPQTKSHKEAIIATKHILNKSIQRIQTRFHNQKGTIWNDISAGIYDVVLFHTKPTTIILFGNEINTLNCLAQLLAQLSGKILGSNDYLILTPKDFPNNVGEVIHNLKLPIIQKKAIIVQDLLSINSEAMKAFHNFCDREKPLVGNAVYIITVIVDGYTSSQREMEFIEKQIFQRLSKYVDKDILAALITRLTDGVIVPVLPESNINIGYPDCSFL
ncbi:PREDICTED: uncharacterized protein LOC108553324 [Eufriesea mexicana]|uniref:uncharacterized protein LOC108553324 n=1 Tax=Eufriesea mexicana TaxID=516756 RepID=UPI00083C39F2|nr:PREDICTED: uncharacterized protein LOC108553324 [Eufriesea mexicana]